MGTQKHCPNETQDNAFLFILQSYASNLKPSGTSRVTSGRHGFSDHIFRGVIVCHRFFWCFVCHMTSVLRIVTNFSLNLSPLNSYSFPPFGRNGSMDTGSVSGSRKFSRTASAENVFDCILLHYFNGVYIAMMSRSSIYNWCSVNHLNINDVTSWEIPWRYQRKLQQLSVTTRDIAVTVLRKPVTITSRTCPTQVLVDLWFLLPEEFFADHSRANRGIIDTLRRFRCFEPFYLLEQLFSQWWYDMHHLIGRKKMTIYTNYRIWFHDWML